MRNLKMILLTFLALFMAAGSLMAQEKVKTEKKKVVIVKETIDEDGKVVTEKIVREGDAADEVEWHQKDGDEKVVIIKKGKGGKKMTVIVDGESDEIDLDEFEHEMGKSINVNVNVDENDGHKNMVIKITGDDGEVETINWQGDGDMSDELKKELEEKGVHLEMIHDNHNQGNMIFIESDRPFLGVVSAQTVEITEESGNDAGEVVEEIIAESEDRGALIGEVVEGSAAEEAGLEKGDVITKINDELIGDFSDLANALGKFKVGDKINISYLRDHKNGTTTATLKKQSGFLSGNHFQWTDDEGENYIFEGDGAKGETIIIEMEDKDGVKEKKVIIKDRKNEK